MKTMSTKRSYISSLLLLLSHLVLAISFLFPNHQLCNGRISRRILFLTGENQEAEIPQPTEAGGYSHTSQSRAKISAANKGKVPWNKGRTRTKEERERISAGVKARNHAILLEKLKEQNMTYDEYLEDKKEKKRQREAERRKRRTQKGGYIPTDETRQKISKILKEKYARGEIRRNTTAYKQRVSNRKGIKHTEETKLKISLSLKNKWANDTAYQEKMKAANLYATSALTNNMTTRERISNTLKEKWRDPEFREYMMTKISSRRSPSSSHHSIDHRRKISEAMKLKWANDAVYRNKATAAMKKTRSSSTGAARAGPSDVTRRKISATMKLKWKQDEYRQKALNATKTKRRVKKSNVTSTTARKKRAKKIKNNELISKKEEKTEPDIQKDLGIENDEDVERITKLRQERRDLYDLLYGDEDFEEEEDVNEEEIFSHENLWVVS